MKTENYLERIAIALETLVSQGLCLDATQEETPEPKEVKPAVEIVTARALTHADLKAICLEKARADSANRDKLKVLLKGYGAVKANDVAVDLLAEIIGKIENGDF